MVEVVCGTSSRREKNGRKVKCTVGSGSVVEESEVTEVIEVEAALEEEEEEVSKDVEVEAAAVAAVVED